MNETRERYDAVNAMWSRVTLPPVTRIEAERAARRLYRHFGGLSLGGPNMLGPVRFNGEVRRCWIISRTNAGLEKGWPRLVHDVSHRIFERRHPNFRPHAGGHATLEREIAEFVVQSRWLEGTLKPRPPAKPTVSERRAKRIAQTEAAIARWQSKRRRADMALKKLSRRHRDLVRRGELDAAPRDRDGTSERVVPVVTVIST